MDKNSIRKVGSGHGKPNSCLLSCSKRESACRKAGWAISLSPQQHLKKIIKHSRLTKVQDYNYADKTEEQIVREIL